MCKLCDAVEQASKIDNINADTSLKLAHAASELFAHGRQKEGDEMVQASLAYWKAPKDAAVADMVQQETQERAQADAGVRDTFAAKGNAGQAEAPALPFVVDNTSGVVYVNGTVIGKLQVVPSLFGDSLVFIRARK